METREQFLEELNKVKDSKRDYLNKVFKYLPDAVIRAVSHKHVKKDEFIIRAGEPCDTVYVILKGNIVGLDYQKLGKVYYFMDFAKMYIIGDFEIFARDSEYGVSICAASDRKYLFMSCKERLMKYLVVSYASKDRTKSSIMRIKKTQTELSERIGFNVRSVQRSIAALEKEELIGNDNGKITVTKEQYHAMCDALEE